MRTRLVAAALAASVVLSAPAAGAQQFINVLTGGTSGVYYPLGVAIAKIYSNGIPGVKTQVQATKASSRIWCCCSRAAARSRSRSATR